MHRKNGGWSSTESSQQDHNHEGGVKTDIQNALLELPAVSYDVKEERPPYQQGHQNLRTFTKLFVHNLDYTL